MFTKRYIVWVRNGDGAWNPYEAGTNDQVLGIITNETYGADYVVTLRATPSLSIYVAEPR